MQFQNLEPMEDDQLSPKEMNEASSGSEDQGSPKANARSYECVFCKRGFSNAQALGGHMNIHRKDRLKLKQPPNIRTRFPFDVPARVASPNYPPAFMTYASQKGFMFRDGESHGEKIHADGPQQLSLFTDQGPSTQSGSLSWQHDESGEPPNRDLATDLDLELRLGPEPPGTSTGLREFL